MTALEVELKYGLPTNEAESMIETAEFSCGRAGIIIHQAELELPARPAIMSLIMHRTKGCKDWTKLLRLKYGTTTGIHTREGIWQDVFGRPQSIEYWNNIYRNIAKLKFDTKAMYFHHRLIRHQLETNYIRSRYDEQQMPHCSFCRLASETEEHLFWECTEARRLRDEVTERLGHMNGSYLHNWGKKTFLLSNVDGNILKPCNILSLYMKKHIWRMRCEGKSLTAAGFLYSFRETIKIIRLAYSGNVYLGNLQLIII